MILIKSISEEYAPTRQTQASAGFDVCSRVDIEIEPFEVVKIPLGIQIESAKAVFPEYLELHPRSSMRANGMIAQVGIVDSDFRDEIMMLATSVKYMKIEKGQRIGQIIPRMAYTNDLRGCETKDSIRGGGFGSTGK